MLKRLELTNEDIQNDIEGFRGRILSAQNKLAEQPESASSWKDRKKLESQRRELESEIWHVENLIRIAREVLATCEC